jgi:P pilus assembly chaperone PapD
MSQKEFLLISNLKISDKIRYGVTYIISLLVFSFLFSFNTSGQGNLMVTPRRVVFDGSKRSVDLSLANIGKDTATYSISMVEIRMKDDGQFETITVPDKGQNFADKNIRFYPRTVTLPPNQAQVVKVQLLKSNQLANAEYRSHLYFRAVPKPNPLGQKETGKDTSTISVSLTPVFGITIPVLIRIGESTSKVSLSALKFETAVDGTPNLMMQLNRSGNFSVYGDLVVDHISTSGKVTRVGLANGLAVYTPNSLRHFLLNLNKAEGVDYSSGKLQVAFTSTTDLKPVMLAESELLLH